MTTVYWLFEDDGETGGVLAGVYTSLNAAKAAGETFEAGRDYYQSFVLEVTDSMPGNAYYHLRRAKPPGRRDNVPWVVSEEWRVEVIE